MHLPTNDTTSTSDSYTENLGHVAAQEDHVQTKWQAAKTRPSSLLWCFFAVLTLVTCSFDQSAALVVLGIPAFRRDFGFLYQNMYIIDANWLAIMSGAPLAASAAGAAVAGLLAEKFGRKWLMTGGLAITFIGVALEFVAKTIQLFFAGKFINGFALGILVPTTIAYLTEIAPLALRGWMTGLANFAFGLGQVVCYAIASSTGIREDRWAYRGIFVAQWGFGVIAIVMSVFAPESPIWLAMTGRDGAALKSLRQLGDSDHAAEGHLANIKITLNAAKDSEKNSTWMDCFRGTNLRRTIICIAPVLVQGFVGLIFVSGYATYYFQLSGISVEDSFKYAISQYVLNLVGNLIGICFIDRIGRRPLMVWGVFALTIILLVAGALGCYTSSQAAVKGIVAMILLWSFVCASTFGAALFAVIPETPTHGLRTKVAAIVVIVQGAFFTMWAFTLPYMFNPNTANLGAKTFFVFGALSALSFVYLFFYQTETANRSFEEIDEMFHKRVPTRKFKGFVTEAQEKAKNAAIAASAQDVGQVDEKNVMQTTSEHKE